MHKITRAAAFASVFSFALASAATAQGRFPFEAQGAVWNPAAKRAWMSLAQLEARARNVGSTADLLVGGGQNGQAVITEFMKDPAAVVDTRGEWIEIKNNLAWRLNLEGWTITDNAGNAHVIDRGGQGLWFFRGERLVLGNNADVTLNGGVVIDYVWTNFSLTNTSDQIVLLDTTGAVVDRVDYTSTAPWPSASGKAIALRGGVEDVLANDDGASWCLASTVLNAGTTDTGTPHAMNDCP
ncbi:MAG: lamin tail domain-containing protein [Planctomycetota bacterium]|nr:lamin tail domain-containing protein [Planctomycetota bacterium]